MVVEGVGDKHLVQHLMIDKCPIGKELQILARAGEPIVVFSREFFSGTSTHGNVNIESRSEGIFIASDDLAILGIILPKDADPSAVYAIAADPTAVGIRAIAIGREIETNHAFL